MCHCRKSLSLSLLICALAAMALARARAEDSGLQLPPRIDVDRYHSAVLPADAPGEKNAVSVDGPVRDALSAASAKSSRDDGPGLSAKDPVASHRDRSPSPVVHRLPPTNDEPQRLPLFVAQRDPAVTAPATIIVPAAKKIAANKEQEPAGLDAAATVAPPAKPALSAEMAALRDRVRSTVAAYSQQSLNTRDNSVSDIIELCLAFGCQTEVLYGSEKLNGITCLCWNYPCGDYQPLMLVDGHVAARVGYGTQTDPAQLLAVLALSRVPVDYPVRVGTKVRSVADLVASEKLSCRAGTDQSFRLIGLAYYSATKDSWKNDRGEPWNLERMIREELARPDAESSVAGANRLLGLGFAVSKLSKLKAPVGDLGRAKKFVEDYQQFALSLQNSDGSWHPLFFAAVGTSRDWEGTLSATAHIFEWLAISLSAEQLENPEVVRSVEYLTTLLANQSSHWNVAALSAKDLDGVMHALHGLNVYDERVFKPRDPKKVEGEEKKAAAEAEKPAEAAKEAK
jgi:hypothetical protein